MNIRDVLYLVLLFLLIVSSSLYSGLDMAYSSVRLSRLESEAKRGDVKSRKAYERAVNYDNTIADILFGNDFVNILSSSIASLLADDLLAPYIGEAASTVSSLVLLVILLIFGEITPKLIARNHSYAIVRNSIYFLSFIEIIFFPFVCPLNTLAKKISGRFVEKAGKESVIASDEELDSMIDEIQKEGIIDQEKSRLLHNSIDFKEISAYQIMTPRVLIHGYDSDTDLEDFLKKENCFAYSRIIVYKHDSDHVQGYILSRELLSLLVQGKKVNIRELLKPLPSVPRTMSLSSVLELLSKDNKRIALVKDEFGGTDGIITFEDILEEMVGELYDEDDKEEKQIRNSSVNNTFIAKGRTNMEDIIDFFKLNPGDFSKDYSTFSGFLTSRLGRFPKQNDIVVFKSLRIQVIEVKDNVVLTSLVQVSPTKEEENKAALLGRRMMNNIRKRKM